MFIGKALELLMRHKESEDAYKRATKIDPNDPIAWKGMLALFEASREPSKYLDAFVGLISALEKAEDVTAAGTAYIKANKYIKSRGDEKSKKKLLFLQLRDSPIFDFLEGYLPPYEKSLKALISMIEQEETAEINKKIAKNKFRIGKDSSMLTVEEAKYKLYSESPLPHLYNELLSTSHDDDLRRKTESNLLKHRYALLLVTPVDAKPALLTEVIMLASDMVVIRALDSLAWNLATDMEDVKDFENLDKDVLQYYSANLTNSGLAKVIQGFLHSEISPFVIEDVKPVREFKVDDNNAKNNHHHNAIDNGLKNSSGLLKEDSEDYIKGGLLDDSNIEPLQEWTPASILEILSEGLDQDPNCALSYRIMATYYLRTQEYESAADFARKGLEVIQRISSQTGASFENGKNHLSAILGTAYVYYEAPKNFGLALKLFDFVLNRSPENMLSIIGKGLILKEMGSLEEAEKLLYKAVIDYPNNNQALVELSWCRILMGKHDEGRSGLRKGLQLITGHDLQSIDIRSQIWWRIGQSYWTCRESQSDTEEAFSCFVNSLQENSNYAPAYTSLGVFYSKVVNDDSKAMKCFYKAFELDPGEINAAELLAADFANKSQWDLVEVIATRVVESDRLKLQAKSKNSWPYRALGIVGLNKRDFTFAVQNFQNSLRIHSQDINSWIGLGEAYSNSGRHTAATKAYTRALELDNSNWFLHYLLAISQKEAYEFSKSIESLKIILKERPQEYGVASTLIDTYLRSARHNIMLELYGEAADDAKQAIRSCKEGICEDEYYTSSIWNSLSLACEIFLTVPSWVDEIPLDSISVLLKNGQTLYPDSIDNIATFDNNRETLTHYMIWSSQLALESGGSDKSSRSIAYYNLGLSYLKGFYFTGHTNKQFLEDSITNLRKAIQLEPRNSEIWNSYGIASESLNIRVAQHSFIRALSLNPKSSVTWANLAVLYLCKGDLELAGEAFEKAQSLDPDYTSAWVGQGLIEYAIGNVRESETIFEHSYLISKGSDRLPNILYGLSKFEQIISLKKGTNIELNSGILALEKFVQLSPEVELALLLQGMLLERTHAFNKGIEAITQAVDTIEQKYEATENIEDIVNFCRAKTMLSRMFLGNECFDEAIEAGQTALDILDGGEYGDNLGSIVLSALLSIGLAHYFNGSFEDSINCFRRCLEHSQEAQDVVILLVQVLWATGGQQQRSAAVEQLYASVDSKGSGMRIALILGVLGLIQDSELLEPCKEELEGLSLEELELDKDAQVQEILSLITQSNMPWQRGALYWPSNHNIWKRLDPRIALCLASGGSVSTEELSEVQLMADSGLESLQRGIFLTPWKEDSWNKLAQCISQQS